VEDATRAVLQADELAKTVSGREALFRKQHRNKQYNKATKT